MKWHVICLVTIFLVTVDPIECVSPLAIDQEPFYAPFTITVLASHHSGNDLFLWTHWSAMVWLYGACPGRVTLCRWKLTWRWAFSRKKRPTKKGRPVPANSRSSPTPVSGKTVAQPVTDLGPSSAAPVAAEGKVGVPSRIVLRPGVILTQRGIQLRPMIARLGEDVEEYRALVG